MARSFQIGDRVRIPIGLRDIYGDKGTVVEQSYAFKVTPTPVPVQPDDVPDHVLQCSTTEVEWLDVVTELGEVVDGS